MMFSNQPLTPQQIANLHRRMDSAQAEMTYGGVPTDIGSGLQSLGTAIGYAMMKHRYDSQFPDAPGGMPQQQNRPPIQSIVEALSGNRMPWQFPAAPSVSGAPANAAPPDRTGWNLPMTSPHQSDRQQPSLPSASTPATNPAAPTAGPISTGGTSFAQAEPGGLLGRLGEKFLGRKSGGGLW